MTSKLIEIKPIKNERDYKNALKQIDTLMDAKSGSADGDLFDVLVTLVEKYEEKHHAIDAPDPISAIEFIMEQRDLERKDMEEYIGSRARVSEVLNHKRKLTLPMIRRLNIGLGIPAEILIRG
jgi:HTH-type transcriptional regulator/antitoxin HigA